MHTGRVVAAIMAWAALAIPAFRQSAPTRMLDLGWGTSPEAMVRAYPEAQCFGERTEVSDWRCILSDTTVNAIDVDVVLHGYSMGAAFGLVGIILGCDSADAHGLVETLVAYYGRWSRVVERDFVTKAEKPFPRAIWLWYLPDVEIRVEQDRETLGHGQAMIMWKAGLNELLARGGTE